MSFDHQLNHNQPIPQLPPAPDLTIDLSLFEAPHLSGIPDLDMKGIRPLSDDALLISWGVSDSLHPSYSALLDISRLPSEITDAEMGLRVIDQSEPELHQLSLLLERTQAQSGFLHLIHERHQSQLREIEGAQSQLLNILRATSSQSKSAQEELARLQLELRQLTKEVQAISSSLRWGSDLELLQKGSQQLHQDHIDLQAVRAAIIPEGQHLITQLMALTGQSNPLTPPTARAATPPPLRAATPPRGSSLGAILEEDSVERKDTKTLTLELKEPSKKKKGGKKI